MVFGIFAILILGIFGSGCTENGNDNTEDNWRDFPIEESSAQNLSGYSEENTERVEFFNISDNFVTNIYFNLTWEDEPDIIYGMRVYENQPDTFCLIIFSPWEEEFQSNVTTNVHGEAGIINYMIKFFDEGIATSAAIGDWEVTIHCGDCGDFYSTGSIGFVDSGNEWELSYYYEYHSDG